MKILKKSSESGFTVLVVGVESQIGAALFEKLSCCDDVRVFGTTRRKQGCQHADQIIHLDLCEPSLFINRRLRFDHVVICASVTSIASCDSNVSLCHQINVEGTSKLIKYFSDCNSQIIFLSSNAVFDGTQPFYTISDNTNPTSNYGKFKVEVETKFQNDSNVAILRLTKVISRSTTFIKRWLEEFDRSEDIRVFEDCFLSPISINEVIDAIQVLISQRSFGIFHLGGEAEISYADYANTFFSNNPKALKMIKVEKRYNGTKQEHASLLKHLPKDPELFTKP